MSKKQKLLDLLSALPEDMFENKETKEKTPQELVAITRTIINENLIDSAISNFQRNKKIWNKIIEEQEELFYKITNQILLEQDVEGVKWLIEVKGRTPEELLPTAIVFANIVNSDVIQLEIIDILQYLKEKGADISKFLILINSYVYQYLLPKVVYKKDAESIDKALKILKFLTENTEFKLEKVQVERFFKSPEIPELKELYEWIKETSK